MFRKDLRHHLDSLPTSQTRRLRPGGKRPTQCPALRMEPGASSGCLPTSYGTSEGAGPQGRGVMAPQRRGPPSVTHGHDARGRAVWGEGQRGGELVCGSPQPLRRPEQPRLPASAGSERAGPGPNAACPGLRRGETEAGWQALGPEELGRRLGRERGRGSSWAPSKGPSLIPGIPGVWESSALPSVRGRGPIATPSLAVVPPASGEAAEWLGRPGICILDANLTGRSGHGGVFTISTAMSQYFIRLLETDHPPPVLPR